jgi:hypothetical protein
MQISTPFTIVTRAPSWLGRVAVSALVSLIPIAGPIALYGYFLRLAEAAATRDLTELPDWSSEDIGELLMRGLKGYLVVLVYSLPLIIVWITLTCCLQLLPLVLAGGSDEQGALAALLMVAILGVELIVVLIGAVATGLVANVGLARLIEYGNVGAALKIGDAIATLRADVRPWFTLLIAQILAGMVAMLGILACGVGVLFTSAYAQCVSGAALGLTIAEQRQQHGPHMAAVDPVAGG